MQRTAILHAEQVRLLYANAPAGFVATALNVVLLALIQWPVIASLRLVTWLAAMLALTALRAAGVWCFQRRAPAPPAIRRWGTLFGLGTLGAGLGWGCAGVWLFPVASLPHQVFLAFVVGGMIAGAVGLLAVRMRVFLSFVCPAAVPIIVHLLAQDDLMSRTMSGMATLFTLVSIFTAWKLHCTIRTSLHLRFDNAALVAEVTAEKARGDVSQLMEAEAEQRRHEAEVLAELARTVNAALEVNTILQRVTEGARELCDSDGAAIALCEPGEEAAVIRYWAGRSYRGFQGVRIEPGEGIGGLVLATGRPWRTDDYGHDPRLSQAYRAVTQAGGTVAVLVVPIRGGARVEGLLYVGATRARTFTDAEEAILQRLADHAAIALHNARLYATAERRRQAAESLAAVGHLLSQSLDAAEVGQRVVAHVRQLLQTRAAALYQLDPATGRLVTLAAANDFGAATTPGRVLPLGMGVVGLALQTRQPVVTANILTDPRLTLPAAVRASLERTPVRAVLALPLLRDGQVIGALSLGDAAGRTFDAEALALGQLFAAYAATAFANAQLYTEVQAGQGRLQDLSRKLLEAQEAERRRMAHELHDEAGQLLASVHLALESTISGLPPQWRAGFQQVRSQLDAIETQLRRLAHELRPTILDDLGLLPALQALAHRVAERTGLGIHVDIALAGRLVPAVETALYRIVQEGLTNITKHAAATHVDLHLWRDDERVHGLLRDDGKGFTLGQTEVRGLGLLGIQERLEALGGTLQISAAPEQGTTLQITLPAAAPDLVADGALPRDLLDIRRSVLMAIRILLADDHVVVRQGVRVLLEQAGMVVIGEAVDDAETLRLAHTHQPEVTVVDIAMPHFNGLAMARRLRETVPQTKSIVLTMHPNEPYVFEALQAGAVGYVVKTQAAADLVQALHTTLQGAIYVSPRVTNVVVKAYLAYATLPSDPLTSREREIVQRIAEGQTTKEIAAHLGLSVKTVESHRINLMRKLDIHETAALVRYAIRRGLTTS